ncbi:MAG: hypothetical protein R3C49_03285 [Planctomycetaceae bacterium]
MTDRIAHQIRLAGPWEVLLREGDWQRCSLPFTPEPDRSACTSGSEIAAGPGIQLRRKFHRPTGINSRTILLIEVTADIGVPFVQVNDQLVAASNTQPSEDATDKQPVNNVSSRFPVTDLIQPFNSLQFEIPEASAVSVTVYAARLLICESQSESPSSRS